MASADSSRDNVLMDTLTNIQSLMRHRAVVQEVDVQDTESEMSIGLDALDFLLTQVITDGCNWVGIDTCECVCLCLCVYTSVYMCK